MKLFAALLLIVACASASDRTLLRKGWAIQASADVREAGAAVSLPGYSTRGWYEAAMPSTVLSALVAAKVYPDPYTGMNLRGIAGTSYPISFNFSNAPMPPDSPFRKSWWFRTDFQVPAGYQGKTVWLGFDGINFRANVWVNGKPVASSDKLAGAWRLFEFDVTSAVKPGAANTLAVEIFPPQPHDLAITFVDWNPQPPDKNMGLWRDVWIAATGPVAIRYPSVTTHLNLPAATRAQLTVRAELKNASSQAVEGVLKGRIEALEFSQTVRLAPHETRVVKFTPQVDKPRLWWPAQVGEQNLYPLDLEFAVQGAVSDTSRIQFGIREITSEVDAKLHRVFHINGKNILIRGAGYTFDMLLRNTPEHQDAELRYVRDMNLNAVRFEGKLEDDHFLELCDRYGILVLAGWCCCDHWEQWQGWDKEDETIAAESLRDQLRRMQRHPALADWMYGSDNPPPPKIEQLYLNVIKEVEWPNPFHSSATAKKTPDGDTGVKMTGPYEYVAPSYWTLDTKFGGAHGFNTETSPGPSPMPIESMRKMLPEERLWPVNSWWDFHAGGGAFKDLHVFNEALDARYGKAASLEDYSRKAQMMAYEGHRAMFEAYGRNKYTSTGVVQWMLNNAWPGLIWHLYDWYLRPGGSYFGAKRANEPLHVQYSYDDRSIVVVNSFYRPFAGLRVSAKVFNSDMQEKFSKSAAVDVGEDASKRIFELPEIAGLSSTYFVNLTLQDAAGKIVSRNFYWLSTTPETLDWEKSNWYYTPTKTFADYSALNQLPPAALQVSAQSAANGAAVTVTNPSRALAFAVHLKISRNGEEVLPVLWEDNYFALLPGETRQVTAQFAKGRGAATVEAEAWNAPLAGKPLLP
ncbi:MAG TPA: glycoside hydrolase family 2 protein [Candidatus Sulfopaludibacter sp.]|jgi:exo-1,4-beta-D-glucosaminidase|nr:glycoside hydrolase family 2 protein [Candidatus Sulfopaludibacter sp.]